MSNPVYDVGVIGGGIAGGAVARDAALRGLSVILFEKKSFGSGTSSKSSKLIHGGIRYLETAWEEFLGGHFRDAWKNFRFVFTSLKESRILAGIAPELVRPIPLLIPIIQGGPNRWTVYGGCWLYYFLSAVTGSGRRPMMLWNKRSVLQRLPGLAPDGIRGGVILWDHWTDDAKLVQETIWSAVRSGAVALEGARVTRFSLNPKTSHYEIAVARDGVMENYFAKKLVNASGPWLDQVRRAGGENKEKFILPVAGSHMNFKKFIPHSVILRAADNRIFFVINSGDISRVGTTERPHENPDEVHPTDAETDYLLEALRRYFPRAGLDRTKIVSSDAAVRPLARPARQKNAHAVAREHEIRTGPTGVLHVIGVKLTDHRRAAEDVVNRLCDAPCVTHKTPLKAG